MSYKGSTWKSKPKEKNLKKLKLYLKQREEIKKFSNWPTIPQLYVNTTLIGGSDIVKAMHVSGELRANLGLSNTA